MVGVTNPKHVRLALWIGRPSADQPVPRLGLGDVLYSPPNPDGTRKRCSNCVFWLGYTGPTMSHDHAAPAPGGREECFLHAADVITTASMVCGYHVFGSGLQGAARPPRENMAPVLPEYSGLMQPEDGSSCDCCSYFTGVSSLEGTCGVASEPDEPEPMAALVHKNGCCAAWHEKG